MSANRARAIFIELVAHVPAEQWQGRLAELAGQDQELRGKVAGLLAAHGKEDSFLEQPAVPLGGTVDLPPAGAAPGTVIGPYKLLQEIGEGGMGTVFMAEQTQPVQRKVALKVIKPGMDSRQVIARFEAERQALAMMDHVNIARVLDAGATEAGLPYFVMELVHGVPITKYCDDNRLTPRARLELFVPVCQAIQHAHQKGIIHRDIKPSNVLVACYDDRPVPKVIDFGIAKATGSQLTEHSLQTGFGAVVGTIEYMSPEQANFNQLDVDTRSDIYSLGVLLYELLAGSPPFTRKEMETAGLLETLRLVREQEPLKPSTRLSTAEGLPTLAANRGTEPKRLAALVRGELDWIVMKALEKDRNRRYETANGFAADVLRYLADDPVQACPPSAGYRLRKFARRHKRALATAAVVVLAMLLALGAVAGSIGWVMRDQSARLAETERQVDLALQEAIGHLKQGKWLEASAAAKRTAALFTGSNNQELLQRMEQLWADLNMVALLEEVRLDQATLKEDSFDYGRADPAYTAAFLAYGIDVATLDPLIAAEKVRTSVICDELVAALDDWVWVKRRGDAAEGERLQGVVKLADPDPWRNRFRDPTVKKDPRALEDLANQPDVAALPPSTVVLLGRALANPGGGTRAKAVAVLSAAQERHPGDFWLNTELAALLSKLEQPQEAAGYFRAALAVRSQSPGSYVGLGNALTECPDHLDNAIAAYHKALNLKGDYAAAYRGLGHAHAKKGNGNEALAAFHKAIELNPTSVAVHLDLYHELIQLGQIEAAFTFAKRAQELGLKTSREPKMGPLNFTVAIARRLAESDRKLPAILRGEARPENASDCIGLGKVCYYKQLYGASARFYEEAFRTKPELQPGNLYAAACAAARAGCGQGLDDPPLDESARTIWRQQALDWLRTDLAALTKELKNNAVKARATLRRWQHAPDLAGLRTLDQLAKLPGPEQEAWLRLWIDVEGLLEQARRKDQ